MGRRLALAGIVVGGILLAAVLFVLFAEFDSPRLGRAALERASALSGARITAQRFRLRLVRGLALQEVEARAADGGRILLSLDELVLDHRLLPLLRRRFDVERIVLRRPRLRLAEGAARAPRLAGAGAVALGAVALRVSAIEVKDGTVELTAGKKISTKVTGLDLRLRELQIDPGASSLPSALTGEGDVRIKEATFETTRAQDLEGDVRVAGGRLEVGDLRFRTPEGRFRARLSVPLDRLPLAYELWLTGDPLDVNAIARAGPGGGFGPGVLELSARGTGAEAQSIVGTGTLRLAAGTLPATPLLAALDAVLGSTRLVGARYSATQAPFRIEQGRVLLDRLHIDGTSFAFDVSGSASLSGPLDLRVTARTPRAGLLLPGVPPGALDVLTDGDGQVVVPLRVTGTQQVPRVAPDVAVLMAQARGAGARGLAEKAGQALGGLFRRR